MDGWDALAAGLAARYFEIDAAMVGAYRLVVPGDPDRIGLLTVDSDSVECGVLPLYFPASPGHGFPRPIVIVSVSPREFDAIRAGDLRLPEGWSIGEEIPRVGL